MSLVGTHKALLTAYGHKGELTRLDSASGNTMVECKCVRRFAREKEELPHDASQSDTWFIVGHDELKNAGFPVPPRKGDRIKEYLDDTITENFTVFEVLLRWEGPTLGGYTLRSRG